MDHLGYLIVLGKIAPQGSALFLPTVAQGPAA
jgi:hypothetical protein